VAGLSLLDGYALIALLVGEPAGAAVRELIRQGGAATPTVSLAETAYVLARRYGIDRRRVRGAIAGLTDGPLAVVSLDAPRALRAGEIHAGHYHRSRCPLSLADAVLLASAGLDDRLATADPHVLSVAAAKGIDSLELAAEE
jgi:predicted nucleic acid-binding protein